MNRELNTSGKQVYEAPACETHTICPEGVIASSGWENGGAGQYDNDWTNDMGGF